MSGKVLVVSYSHTGRSRHVAQMLARMQEWPRAEIADARPRHGVPGFVRSLLDSMLRRQPSIRYKGPSLVGYDAVVLVSPVWASRMAGPMRTFVVANRTALRDVAIVSVMKSGGADKVEAELAHLLGRKPMMAAAFTAREIADGTCGAPLEAFARRLQAAEDRAVAAGPRAWTPQAV